MSTQEFLCERCHYTTSQKGHLARHLTKNKVCSPTHHDVSREQLLQQLDIKAYSKNKCFACDCCESRFTDLSNLNRHKKTKHTTRNEPSTSTTNAVGIANTTIQGNNNTANITNNITIELREFGNENIDHILSNFQFLYDCFYSRDIGKLIEYIYADPAHPENQNVRLQNQRMKLMEKFLNKSWKTQDMDDMLQQLVDRGYSILANHKRKNEDDIKERLFEDDYNEGEEEEFEREFNEMIRWLVKLGRDPAGKELKKSLYIIFRDLKKANTSCS